MNDRVAMNVKAWSEGIYPVTIGLIWDAVRRQLGLGWAAPMVTCADLGEIDTSVATATKVFVLIRDRERIPERVDDWIRLVVAATRRHSRFARLPIPLGLRISQRLDAEDGFSMRVIRDYAIMEDQCMTRLDVAIK